MRCDAMRQVADDYTNAWNSGSPDAVAEFFAPDGGIVINRGTSWEGRNGVAQMAAGFYADIPDLRLVCDGLRVAGTTSSSSGRSPAPMPRRRSRCGCPAGRSKT